MATISLNCNHCGAPLAAPDTVKHVTCGHCGAALVVRFQGGAYFTERLERLEQTTDTLAEQVASLERRQQLSAIDDAWRRQEERLMVRGKHGERYKPSAALGVLVMAGGLAFAVFSGAMLSSSPAPNAMSVLFPLFGLAGGVLGGGYVMMKARAYQRARRAYIRQRMAVISPSPSSQSFGPPPANGEPRTE